METIKLWFISGWEWLCNATVSGIGTSLVATGVIIEQFAIVVIMAGVLLWMCRYTKVFRCGMISYLIGFILEIVGLIIR